MSATMPEVQRPFWTCPHCTDEAQTDPRFCQSCGRPRYASWAIQVAEHVTEHIGDGLATPLEVLGAMEARGCYKGADLTLAFIAQQMRLLTKDTTALARSLAKARAARTMLDVLETGDSKDKLAVLKGIQVLGDVVEVKGETVTRHVVELHEGPPPARRESE
jgi:DnaJ-class molecular chaperone